MHETHIGVGDVVLKYRIEFVSLRLAAREQIFHIERHGLWSRSR